jgi:hypothetical protein
VQELARQGMPMAIATLKRIATDKKGATGRAAHFVGSKPGRLPDAATISENAVQPTDRSRLPVYPAR